MARALPVSNPDKVLYPATGFTKAEVVDYYRAVAPVLVPHLKGRALTLRRFPDGVDGESFFEKRCPSHAPPWVTTVEVARSSGASYRACSVEDADTLLWLANLAAIELHPSLALAGEPEQPTTMVFDLDPGLPAALPECAEVACSLRQLLSGRGEGLGLRVQLIVEKRRGLLALAVERDLLLVGQNEGQSAGVGVRAGHRRAAPSVQSMRHPHRGARPR